MNRELWQERIRKTVKIGFIAFLVKGLLWSLLPLLWFLFDSSLQ